MSEEKKAKVKTSTPAVRVDIPVLLESLKFYPANTPICIQGRSGIGKSETVAQVASTIMQDFYKDPKNCEAVAKVLAPRHPTVARVLKANGSDVWKYEFGTPMIMRRLAQTLEGDVTGVPRIVERTFERTNQSNDVTQFKSLDWVLDGVEFPVVLFLDERNRALDAVKQAVFEMLDSHGFNGHAFHEGTRVMIAENIGDDYQVQALDPAEISRTALFHLEPSIEAWLEWAKKNCHPDVYAFIKGNKDCLEYTGTFEANKKYPDRRAWKRLSDSFAVLPKTYYEPKNNVFATMVKSFVGMDAGFQFLSYLTKKSKELTAEQILTDWDGNKSVVCESDGTILVEIYVDLAKKLANHIKTHKLKNASEKDSLKAFMKECPSESRTALFTTILSGANKEFYAEFNEVIASAVGSSVDISSKAPAPKKK